LIFKAIFSDVGKVSSQYQFFVLDVKGLDSLRCNLSNQAYVKKEITMLVRVLQTIT
jgi:hypothetical protein